MAVLVYRALRADGLIASLVANLRYHNRKRQTEIALHRDLELLREQRHQRASTSQEELCDFQKTSGYLAGLKNRIKYNKRSHFELLYD